MLGRLLTLWLAGNVSGRWGRLRVLIPGLLAAVASLYATHYPQDGDTFGYTSSGRYLAVVWERVDDDPLTMYPVTAYDAPERRR